MRCPALRSGSIAFSGCISQSWISRAVSTGQFRSRRAFKVFPTSWSQLSTASDADCSSAFINHPSTTFTFSDASNQILGTSARDLHTS